MAHRIRPAFTFYVSRFTSYDRPKLRSWSLDFCSLGPNSAPYVVAQTVSVSSHRAEMAAAVGRTADVPRLEPGRGDPGGASVRPTPRLVGARERGEAAAEMPHPRHVSLSLPRGAARRASRGVHRH